MGRQFKPKTKKSLAPSQALQLETALDQALHDLHLSEEDIRYIKEPLYSLDFAFLYQRIFHLFLLNPELRTQEQGEQLRKALLMSWQALFNDTSLRSENEKKLQTALNVLIDYYSPEVKLQQKNHLGISKKNL